MNLIYLESTDSNPNKESRRDDDEGGSDVGDFHTDPFSRLYTGNKHQPQRISLFPNEVLKLDAIGRESRLKMTTLMHTAHETYKPKISEKSKLVNSEYM